MIPFQFYRYHQLIWKLCLGFLYQVINERDRTTSVPLDVHKLVHHCPKKKSTICLHLILNSLSWMLNRRGKSSSYSKSNCTIVTTNSKSLSWIFIGQYWWYLQKGFTMYSPLCCTTPPTLNLDLLLLSCLWLGGIRIICSISLLFCGLLYIIRSKIPSAFKILHLFPSSFNLQSYDCLFLQTEDVVVLRQASKMRHFYIALVVAHHAALQVETNLQDLSYERNHRF
jgi:hypothetical protein